MRNMLAFLAAVVLTVIGAGWYLDWYKVQSNPAPAGKRSLSIDINTVKIGADLHKGLHTSEQKIQGMLENNKDKKPGAENSVPGKDGETQPGKDAPAKVGIPAPPRPMFPSILTPRGVDGAVQ